MLLLVLHYNKNHSYVLFVHIFLDSIKSQNNNIKLFIEKPLIENFIQTTYGQNQHRLLGGDAQFAGGCRYVTPRYFLIGHLGLYTLFRLHICSEYFCISFNIPIFYMNIAIHTVFILKENILFLEEWINYHMLLGFNKFYLYDNSKINKIKGWDEKNKHIKPGQVNKYNINYDKIVNMNDIQMNDYVKKLCDKYKCVEIIEWSPMDNKGNTLYNQKEAHNHCLKKLKIDKVDWCASIDMDEYITITNFDNISKYISSLPPSIQNIKMGQILFDSRFNNLDKLVTEITDSYTNRINRGDGNKNIFNVESTIKVDVHSVTTNGGNCKHHVPAVTEIWFNHYKLNMGNNYKHVNNIHQNIKMNKDTFIPIN